MYPEKAEAVNPKVAIDVFRRDLPHSPFDILYTEPLQLGNGVAGQSLYVPFVNDSEGEIFMALRELCRLAEDYKGVKPLRDTVGIDDKINHASISANNLLPFCKIRL